MKNTVLLFALVFCFQAFAQRKPKIKGNKNVVEVREELPPFNAIELNDDLEIFLEKSSSEACVINADDNLIDVLKFKVVDSTLIITSFYKITAKKKLDIKINYQELNAITVRDGKINMKDVISSDVLNVQTFGSARLVLNANADLMNIEMEGISSGDFNIVSDSLNITMKDRTDAGIYAVSETSVISMHKNASAKVEGNTDELLVNLNENSSLKAETFDAESVFSVLKGSSTARIYARTNFQLNSSGSSKTMLYGDAKIEILEFLDTSQLHKEKIK